MRTAGQTTFAAFVSLTLVIMLGAGFPALRPVQASPPQERGQGNVQKDDSCVHLPDPPGKADGIDKQCPAGGSSSGIAKGDFNGDGYADLAVAEPGATIVGQAGAPGRGASGD